MKVENYSKRTIWIHWISTLLIFGLIGTGVYMEGLTVSIEKFTLYKIHFSLGILVFFFTLIRLVALFKDKRPNSLYAKSTFMWYLLEGVHYGFYLVIMWMCISGMLSLSLEGILPALLNAQLADLPEIISDGFHPIMLSHHIIAKIVFLLLIMHIGGVVLYYARFRTNTLKRIWYVD